MTEAVALACSGHRTARVFRRYDITSYKDKVRTGEGLSINTSPSVPIETPKVVSLCQSRVKVRTIAKISLKKK